uniref:Uncharacterized protein n=1 Tax=Lactuca sativa TaxID=4236 RepID=A0A9R1VP73_LACSA|nr:hypothetical protein LSAT_V11C500288820 [Lactuca sativa]
MSSNSSTSRNRLQVTYVQVREGVQLCDCDVPAKERTYWKITKTGRYFWKCQNSLTRFKKFNFFECKDDEHEEGYYKNLLYSLKQKLDAKEDLSQINTLRKRIDEVEFLMGFEHYINHRVHV